MPANVIIDCSVSLDGFIADRSDHVGALFDWYFNGDTEVEVAPHQFGPSGGYRPGPASAEILRETWSRIGAVVIGRRLFDLTDGWGGKPAVGDSVFVVTHRDPGDWPARYPDAPFQFVTDGVAAGLARAKLAAGGRDVALSGGDLAGQAARLGLVDQVLIHLVPVVFGAGVRLFGEHDVPVTLLEDPEIVEGDRVTHLRYRVRG